MLKHLIPDILRRFRIPAQTAGDVYQKFRVSSLIVDTTPIPLSNQPVPSDFLLIMASLENEGIVYIGDSQVSSTNGLELDAGRAFVISPNTSIMESANIQGQTALGLLPYIEGMSALEQRQYLESLGNQLRRTGRRLVINVADLWLVASQQNQSVRIFYTLIPER